MKKTDVEIVEAINNSLTMREASKKLNMAFSSFKRMAIRLGVFKPNQGGKNTTKKHNGNKIDLQKIFNGLYPTYQTRKLKDRILKEGLKKEICEKCGLKPIWNGEKLILHLDHKDGNSCNHKFENLQLLCPNCHSQTETYCGKNLKLKNKENGYTYKSPNLKHLNKQ